MSKQKNQNSSGIQDAVDRLWDIHNRLNHPPKAKLSRYPKEKPKLLPENVVELPPVGVINRAPLPMNLAFDALQRIKAGLPLKIKGRVWVADERARVELMQRTKLPVSVIGQPVLVKRKIKRSRLRERLNE